MSGARDLVIRPAALPAGQAVVVGLVGVTVVKLVLTGVVGSTVDVSQMLAAARAVLAGLDLLDPANTGGDPNHLAFGHALIATAALLAAQALGVSFDVTIKAPAILADLGAALLLRRMPRGGDSAAMLYMLNPLTLLLSVYHGQLHSVAVAGAVFALWLADRGRQVGSGFVLALTAAVRQHFAVLIAVVPTRTVRGVTSVLVFAAATVLLNVPLLQGSHPERLLAPVSNYGLWGYSMVLQHGPHVLSLAGFDGIALALRPVNRALDTYAPAINLLWAAAFVAGVWRGAWTDRWRASLLFLLGIYALGTGFGVQRLIWALPFWIIVNWREALTFSLLGSAYTLASYWQWTLNAKYGVQSVMANLHVLAAPDFVGLLVVGGLGFLTWAYCTRAAWRLVRVRSLSVATGTTR